MHFIFLEDIIQVNEAESKQNIIQDSFCIDHIYINAIILDTRNLQVDRQMKA